MQALSFSGRSRSTGYGMPRFGAFHRDIGDCRAYSALFRQLEVFQYLPGVIGRLLGNKAVVHVFGMANGLDLMSLYILNKQKYRTDRTLQWDLSGSDVLPEMVTLAETGILSFSESEFFLAEQVCKNINSYFEFFSEWNYEVHYGSPAPRNDRVGRLKEKHLGVLRACMSCKDLLAEANVDHTTEQPFCWVMRNIWGQFNLQTRRQLALNLGNNLPAGSLVILGKRDLDPGSNADQLLLATCKFQRVAAVGNENPQISQYFFQKI